MLIINFVTGLCFGGLGLAAYLQLRREGEFPLKHELSWMAAFGFAGGIASWIDMFLVAENSAEIMRILDILRITGHLVTAVLLLRFGWGVLSKLDPLPAWAIFIPGILIVPIAFVITYAATTFVTPSPIEIPVEIWTRYLLYLPGSFMAGIGFLRQWYRQRKQGSQDVASLMLGAGIAFLIEAVVVGLIVPAAPYGPASYYNYDRVIHNAFVGESAGSTQPYGFMSGWLDYEAVLHTTGLPIEFWRMLSAVVVTLFVVKALDVFEAIRRQQVLALQQDRDRARQAAFQAQIEARQTAEEWTKALISTGRRIAELEHVDDILLNIVDTLRKLLMADFAGVAILDERRENLELRCFSTVDETSVMAEPAQVVSNPLIQEVLASFHSYCSPGGEPVARLQGLCLHSEQAAGAAAIVPLLMENTAMGVMWVARSTEQPFTDTDLVWLEGMGDQVEIAIQHGLMTAQLQSLSVVEERGRIAREMHDGLAQVLGYLNLQVQTLGSLLKQGKDAQLQQELNQMRHAVQTANADVRENILSLRTTLAADTNLASAVQEYLQEFGIQTGIETSLLYEVEGQLQLASMAEVQLVCILQEALTNVRKHAHASHVRVSISRNQCKEGEEILMRVQDNGVGYAPSGSKRSFGVQTMRERAQSVRGKLSIHSRAGEGTEVECRLPCLPAERLPRQSAVIH